MLPPKELNMPRKKPSEASLISLLKKKKFCLIGEVSVQMVAQEFIFL